MFPKSQKILEISNEIILNWHHNESKITSIDDAIKIIENKNENDIIYHIQVLSLINTTLWHEEDKARDRDAPNTIIAETKRKIDKLNNQRVNKTEKIDNLLFENINFNKDAPLNTETVGSVIDRLTIISLKKFHMKYESTRKDSNDELRKECKIKLNMISRQMSDLTSAYDTLLNEIRKGKRRYALYRQFKMYNDPDLNPVLYCKK